MSFNLQYQVPLIPQPDKLSCWAASMAMLVSYKRNTITDPQSLAIEVNRILRTSYNWDTLEEVKSHFGFKQIFLSPEMDPNVYPLPKQSRNYAPVSVT